MAMQISSLQMGGVTPVEAPQSEYRKEKPPPLPIEQRGTDEQVFIFPQASKAPDLKQTAAELEKIGLAFNRRLKFVIDQESKEIIVKVIDNETDKVIRILPPEELQRLHNRISETMGFLFDRMI